MAINPAAGGRRASVGPAVVAGLRAAGLEVEGIAAEDYAILQERVLRAVATGPRALIVVGGDGMVNLGANGVAGTAVPLGIVPAGTGNDVARALGIGDVTPADAVARLRRELEAPQRSIDAARVTLADGTERWFAGVLSAGFDAVVNERANRLRRPRGSARYLVALGIELARLRPLSYRLTLDGREEELDAVLVAVGNGTSIGGGMKVVPDAQLDDGLLDVLVVEPLSRLAFLRIFPRVFAGTHVSDRRVRIERASTVRIDGEGLVAYGDGERFGALPVSVEVVPGALTVLATPAD